MGKILKKCGRNPFVVEKAFCLCGLLEADAETEKTYRTARDRYAM